MLLTVFWLMAKTLAAQPAITYAEFFVDNDPGRGQATPLLFTAGSTVADVAIQIDTAGLAPGIHFTGVRARDNNGAWSLNQLYYFLRPYPMAAPADTTVHNIVYAEYFIGADPGLGKATSIAFTASRQLSDLLVPVDTGSLGAGIHYFTVRARNSAGVWSLNQTFVFYRPLPPAGGGVADTAHIVYSEYYLNTDPGRGKATSVAITPATTLQNLLIQLDTTNMVHGANLLVERARDAAGKWSLDQLLVIFKPAPYTPAATPLPAITYLEYYVNQDPGLGQATSVPLSPATDLANLTINFNTVGLDVGNYELFVRGRDTAGNWSLAQRWAFKIEVPAGYEITMAPLPDTLCTGQLLPIPFTVNAPFGVANEFIAQLSDHNGGFTNPREIGRIATRNSDTVKATIPSFLTFGTQYRIRLLATTPYDTSEVNGNPITITRAPSQVRINGKTEVCPGTENYASFNNDGNLSSYRWQLAGGGNLTFNGVNASVNWTTGGAFLLKLEAFNYCGTRADSIMVSVVDTPLAGPFANMLPTDSNSNLTLPVTFSWFPINKAVAYDLYVWPTNQSRPVTPFASNISSINYTIHSGLDYEKYYNWQLVAKRACYTLESPVQVIQLRFLPDLIVNNITLPANAFSGQNLSISWEIKNQGQGSTLNQQWFDLVYLSQDAVRDNTDLLLGSVNNLSALAAGASYVQNATFSLPQGINDQYYIIIRTNPYSQVLENNYNNNEKVSATTVFVQLTPPPDLQVTNIITPNIAFSNQEIDITYTVTNKGTGGTRTTQWIDYIYLSQDTAFTAGTARYAGSNHHTSALDANDKYDVTRRVKLPEGSFGNYYIYVVTDVFNQVYEHANEQNNRSRSTVIDVRLTPPVDLVVKAGSIAIPQAASNKERVTVQWQVDNLGGSSTAGKYWYDVVYLSKRDTFNKDSAMVVAYRLHGSTVEAGEGYSAQAQFDVPGNITGPYYVFVFTDGNNHVFEHTFENNNIGRSSSTLLVQSPDLIVPSVSVPASDTSGRQVNIQYTIKNNGPGQLYNTSQTDNIYLSASSTFSAAAVPVGSTNYHTGHLAPGDSIQRNMLVRLPNGTSGQFYVFVITDANNNIYEAANENNNTGRSPQPINILLAPWPDLVVTQITVPDTAVVNNMVAVEYSIKNQGLAATADSVWNDAIYLSRQPVFNAASATLLRDVARNGRLAGNSVYTVNTVVKLPPTVASGDYYVYVVTDVNNVVYEHTDENNNVRRQGLLHIAKYPPVDLVVTAFTGPASVNSGQQVNIHYQVLNSSAVATLRTQWFDGVYLSADDKWDRTGDILIREFDRRGGLLPAATYQATETFHIPNGISGSYHLLIVADHNDVNADANRANNIGRLTLNGLPLVTNVTLTPPADLVVTALKVPDQGPAGQPITIGWRVKNQGLGTTNSKTWAERAFLSTNLVLDAGDVLLGSYIRNDSLKPGQEYADSMQVFLPNNASGNYIIIFKTDATDNVYEHTAENNNTAHALITVTTPPQSDLVVQDIAVPLTAVMAGENATISWKVRNTGANPAVGYMKEGVYLSLDTVKDISDVLLQSVEGFINLPPNASVSHSITRALAGVSLQDYYVIVHTDIVNNIVESNDTNNIGYSANKLMVTVPQLVLNEAADRVLRNNAEAYYRIEIPDLLAGESLLVSLWGDSVNGTNELYLRHGQVPTRVVYDHAYSLPFEGNQQVIAPVLQPGIYYLMVYGSTSQGSQQNIALLATILPFEIRSVNANQGGNTGRVTVRVDGSRFGDVTRFTLRRGVAALEADSIRIVNPTRAFATFNLAAADVGLYHLVAENAKQETATLPDGFEVVPGISRFLQTSLLVPPSTRPSNIISIAVQFTNAGNTDIMHPVLVLHSLGGSPIGFNVSQLDAGATQLELPLREVNGPPGVLRPGASGTITVYSKAVSNLLFSLSQP